MLLEMSVSVTLAAAARTGRFTPEQLRQFRDELLWEEVMRDGKIPRLADVIAAESALSKTRCVGPVVRWNRKFAFTARRPPIRLDTSTIEFVLATPHGDYRPGRDIVKPEGLAILDDGFFDTAQGTYSIRTHRVTFSYCGPNHPGAPEGPNSRPRAPSIDRPDRSPRAG